MQGKLARISMGHDLKTASNILNRVPTKSVEGTPFELRAERKPSLNHLHWGCKAEAKIYNLYVKKPDANSISCYCVGYADRSKGYRFYCLNQSSNIVETGRAIFFEHLQDEDPRINLKRPILEEIFNDETIIKRLGSHVIIVDISGHAEEK